MRDLTFAVAVREAEALRRLGQTTVYLDSSDPDLPWTSVTACNPGCTHRNGICVSLTMTAECAGLTFRWFVDIEPRNADGKPMIDVTFCRRIAALLPQKPRGEFATHLADCSAKCAEFAAEFDAWAAAVRAAVAQAIGDLPSTASMAAGVK
jgi:hypothetical protein